jgi:NodT family efflux transporter outer membrane factor (OMF) lipoprotein
VVLPAEFPPATEAGATIDPHWHRTFGDAELDALIARVLAHNTSLHAASERLAQVRQLARQSGAASWPQLTTESAGTRTRTRDRSSGRATTSSSTEWTHDATLSWELDLWGRVAALRRQGRLEIEATREDRNAIATLLVSRTVETWIRCRGLASELALVRAQLETSERHLALNELRLAQGIGSALAVWQQRSQVLELKARLPEVERQLSRERSQLGVLAAGDALPPTDVPTLPDLPPSPLLPRPAELAQTRPDLRAAWARIQAADAGVASAAAERLPTIGFSLEGLLSSPKFADPARVASLLAGPTLTLPWLDGGARRAEVERRRAVVREQLWQFADLLLRSAAEVQDAANDEALLARAAETLFARQAAAEATLMEARGRFTAGQSSYLDVLDALRARQQVERERLSVEVNRRIARVQLYAAFGYHLEDQP